MMYNSVIKEEVQNEINTLVHEKYKLERSVVPRGYLLRTNGIPLDVRFVEEDDKEGHFVIKPARTVGAATRFSRKAANAINDIVGGLEVIYVFDALEEEISKRHEIIKQMNHALEG